MLQFKQTDTSKALILTLTENVSLDEPFYLFVFTHVLTKQTVSFIKTQGQDESDFPNRYNQFTINPAVIFLNKPIGEWHYKVYEQESDTNTDTTLAGNVLEYGKLMLLRDPAYAPTKYNETTSFIAYNG